MPRPKVTSQMTTAQVARQLSMGINQLLRWVEHGALPPPSSIDKNGVRYFDRKWLRKAKQIVSIKK